MIQIRIILILWVAVDVEGLIYLMAVSGVGGANEQTVAFSYAGQLGVQETVYFLELVLG